MLPALPSIAVVLIVSLGLLAGCGKHLPGTWELRCDASLLVPDGDRCRASLRLEQSHLALFPEGEGWLLAAAWTGPEIQLIQATVDTPVFRQSVRLEDGFCAGPICWLELDAGVLDRMAARHAWRVELSRIFPSETGGTRRGTMAFHATTRGLTTILPELTAAPVDPGTALDPVPVQTP